MALKKKAKGQLIVLSGPSGVGKSTVIAELLGQRQDIHFSVSFTTRKPRVGEANGVNYNFVERDEFERMIADGELLEHAEYVNNYYGTSLKVIQEKLDAGVDVLLDIEVQGAAKVRSKCPDAVLIFIIPLYPSRQDLLNQVPSRYPVVHVVAHRAREIAADADEQGYPLNDKPVSIAIRESAEGKVDLSVPEQH